MCDMMNNSLDKPSISSYLKVLFDKDLISTSLSQIQIVFSTILRVPRLTCCCPICRFEWVRILVWDNVSANQAARKRWLPSPEGCVTSFVD